MPRSARDRSFQARKFAPSQASVTCGVARPPIIPPASRSYHTPCIDEATERALANLMELTGLNKSEVVRKTIQEAERQAIIERVRRQADALREDPKDRVEMLALADEMDSLRAW